MRAFPIVLLVALLMPLLPAGASSLADEALPTDPALVTGALPNGLRYIVRPHKNPEGRVSIWLHIATGSLNETDSTRGLAHYLEHLAFNGSTNFPPGSVVPFFQSLGLTFGRDQNAFTSFDQTTYQLALPSNGRDVIQKGLLFMSDVAMRSASSEKFESERQIILEEARALEPDAAVHDQVYERLAPESTFGRRLPIGVDETLKTMSHNDVVDYYSRWYVPSNMTLIVVGDADPAMVVDLIRQEFAAGASVPRPTPRAVGVKPTAASRAIVASDPELTRAEVSIVRVSRAASDHDGRPSASGRPNGTWVFNRRVNAESPPGACHSSRRRFGAHWVRAAHVGWRPAGRGRGAPC
jgi:zinc protease